MLNRQERQILKTFWVEIFNSFSPVVCNRFTGNVSKINSSKERCMKSNGEKDLFFTLQIPIRVWQSFEIPTTLRHWVVAILQYKLLYQVNWIWRIKTNFALSNQHFIRNWTLCLILVCVKSQLWFRSQLYSYYPYYAELYLSYTSCEHSVEYGNFDK